VTDAATATVTDAATATVTDAAAQRRSPTLGGSLHRS
jgi:hypothetical protein